MIEFIIVGGLALIGALVYSEHKADRNRKEEGLDRLD